MSMMITRLRHTITLLSARGAQSTVAQLKDSAVFDGKLLDKLVDERDDSTHMRYMRIKVIVQEGQAGVLMYVLLAINRNVFIDLVKGNPKFAVSLLGAVGDRARCMSSQLA